MKRTKTEPPSFLRHAHFVRDEFQEYTIQEEADSLERR